MVFRWDPEKAAETYRKRHISFQRATEVFKDPFRIDGPNHFEGNEERWQIIGMTANNLLLFVVYTIRYEDGEEITRIISVRRADPKERSVYGNRKL